MNVSNTAKQQIASVDRSIVDSADHRPMLNEYKIQNFITNVNSLENNGKQMILKDFLKYSAGFCRRFTTG